MKGFKIVDNIFYYPGTMPDQAIETDLLRSFMRQNFDYNSLIQRGDVILAYPTSVRKRDTMALIEKNVGKKIIFVYWGENIFGYFRLISQVHALLKKFSFPMTVLDKCLFNALVPRLLSIYSPLQVDTYFKHIVKKASSNHFFILTNDLNADKYHVYFAPYFYYFCQDRIQKIVKQDTRQSVPKKFCAFIVSNPNNIDRIEFFRKLSRYKKIDSFGKVLNNKNIDDLHKDHIIADAQRNDRLYEEYKFVICFENSYAKGYITEKIINAIAGGAIPIYRGAPDVGQYFNASRIVNYDDCGRSYDKMVEMIIALDQDEARYRQFIQQPVFKSPDIQADLKDHDNRLRNFISNILQA